MASQGLCGELPLFARARGFRLYDLAGRRYLDLWQSGGEAFLGHRPTRLIAEVKDVLARGLSAALPTPWEGRLVKMLARMFRDRRSFRLYLTRERALAAASRWIGRRLEVEELPDPAVTEIDPSSLVALWRPCLPSKPGALPGPHASGPRAEAHPAVLVPVLPWTIGGSPAVLCFGEKLAPDEEPSEKVPAPILAGAHRGLAELARGGRPDPFGSADLAHASAWERRGPYLSPRFGPEEWPRVFRKFLASGLLLPPAFPGPAILPAEASAGERRLVISMFTTSPGG